jgi:hypothetical protein
MTTSASFEALRRANPRSKPSFTETVNAAAAEVRSRIAAATVAEEPRGRQLRPRHRLVGATAAGVALATAAAVAAFLTVGSSGVTPGVGNAAAAIKKAVTLTAASAEQSGTATIRMTHHGRLWAHKTVRWHDNDLEISDNSPGMSRSWSRAASAAARARSAAEIGARAQSGLPLRLVNGMMYGHDSDHDGWVELGPLSSIDPGSGTTPTDILAAVRADVGGRTLRRIIGAMTAYGLTTAKESDGSTVYSGTVRAGEIATEAGFKGGQAIRVFPFGYVAHGAAADPASLLDTAVTIGSDGIIREIAVTWGPWTYTVTYSDLGSAPPLVAPANAKSLSELRHLQRQP